MRKRYYAVSRALVGRSIEYAANLAKENEAKLCVVNPDSGEVTQVLSEGSREVVEIEVENGKVARIVRVI